jgi:hypothetical protein
MTAKHAAIAAQHAVCDQRIERKSDKLTKLRQRLFDLQQQLGRGHFGDSSTTKTQYRDVLLSRYALDNRHMESLEHVFAGIPPDCGEDGRAS